MISFAPPRRSAPSLAPGLGLSLGLSLGLCGLAGCGGEPVAASVEPNPVAEPSEAASGGLAGVARRRLTLEAATASLTADPPATEQPDADAAVWDFFGPPTEDAPAENAPADAEVALRGFWTAADVPPRAILAIGGELTLLAAGEEHAGVSAIEVGGGGVTLERDGARWTLALADVAPAAGNCGRPARGGPAGGPIAGSPPGPSRELGGAVRLADIPAAVHPAAPAAAAGAADVPP